MSSKFQILISKNSICKITSNKLQMYNLQAKNMNLNFLRIGHQNHTYKFGNQNWEHFGLWSLTKLWTLPQRNNISSTTNCHYVKMVAHYPTTSAHRLQPQRSNPFLIIILEFGIWTNSYTKFLPNQLPISKS